MGNPNTFEFKYEGTFNGLDASLVLNTQLQFLTVLQEIKETHFPEIELEIKLKGLENGSLNVNHLIEIASVTGMFLLEHHDYIKTLFEIFKDLIALKLTLKDGKAEEIKPINESKISISVNGNNNNVIIHPGALQVYQNNQTISDALCAFSKSVQAAPEIEYVQLSAKAEDLKIARISRSEFPLLAQPNGYLKAEKQHQVHRNQVLFVKKPHLLPEPKKKWIWELLHKGRPIQASIKDSKFRQQINDGLKLGQGDRLLADLTVAMKFDEKLQTFVETKTFEVSNITQIIPRSIEPQLPLD